MHEMDRVVPLQSHDDRPRMSARERMLMLDEMEETARAIRERVGGFGDVGADEALGLDAAQTRPRSQHLRRRVPRAYQPPMVWVGVRRSTTSASRPALS